MAGSDVVVVDVESGALDPAPLARLRRANPAGELLAYLASEEIPRDEQPDERPVATARFDRVDPSQWVVEPGSPLAAPVSATATRLRVEDGGAFSLRRPASAFYGEDEPTYLLIGGEHVKLVDVQGDELVVERGHRSAAVAHAAGEQVAAHVVFFAGTWMLNLSANAPAAPAGQSWREQLIDEAAALVDRGPWTGVFLDVCFEDLSWLNGGLLDLDRDGTADEPADASAQWSAGMGLLVDAMRARLGPDVPLISNPGGQNCPHPALDGILLEGWPLGLPADYLDFETGLARYLDWSSRGRFTIANAFSPKIGFGTIEPGRDDEARDDHAAMRFGLGVALLGDGLYAFDNGVFGHYVAWRYDEYDGGGRGRHWLGAARGPATGSGPVRQRAFEHGLVVVNLGDDEAVVEVPPGYARLEGRQDPVHNDGTAVEGRLRIAGKDAYVLRRLER